MGWQPAEFWRATFHDFTSVMWARKQQVEAQERQTKPREMTSDQAASMLGAMARRDVRN